MYLSPFLQEKTFLGGMMPTFSVAQARFAFFTRHAGLHLGTLPTILDDEVD
jgi:hypothetical protein